MCLCKTLLTFYFCPRHSFSELAHSQNSTSENEGAACEAFHQPSHSIRCGVPVLYRIVPAISVQFPISRWLSQERIAQAAVHWNYVAGGFSEAIRDKQEERLRLIGRSDGALRQRPVRVEFGEARGERVGWLTLGVGDAVF